MNEKVKVKFMRYKNIVLMEVLEMPEKYRGKGELIASLDEKVTIRSLHHPHIRDSVLFLRGDLIAHDDDCDVCVYNTPEDALEGIKKFSNLIHELNERDAETTEPTSDGEVEITIAE